MIIALFIFWIILSGELSAFFISAACVCIWFIYKVDKKLFLNSSFKIKLKWFILFFKLLKDMLISTFSVMKIIWLNKQVQSDVSWQDNPGKTDIAKVAYANAITLTPGTMTLELKDDKILVHSIMVNS